MNTNSKIAVGALAGFVLGALIWGWGIGIAFGLAVGFITFMIVRNDSTNEEKETFETHGYTEKAVRNYTTEIRSLLTTMRDHAHLLEANLEERGAALKSKIGKTSSQVEKVISKLNESPEDMRLVGLLFQSVQALEEGLKIAGQQAVHDTSSSLFEAGLEQCDKTLDIVADVAEKKLSGAMSSGDLADMLGNFHAAASLAQS